MSLPSMSERIIGRTFGGIPITVADLADALGCVYSGDQTIDADALADVFEDRQWQITRIPDYRAHKNPRAT